MKTLILLTDTVGCCVEPTFTGKMFGEVPLFPEFEPEFPTMTNTSNQKILFYQAEITGGPVTDT